MKSVVVDASGYDWEGDAPLRTPSARSVIYEMHVGAFTRHPSSGVAPERRGTFAGMQEKIPYLRDLGVTAVELLPVFHFDAQAAPAGRSNVWGYAPVSFFAPHLGYAAARDAHGAITEFRDLVKALHRAGIEVILDVVFNHTTLEHVYEVQVAFRNLCALSRDVVILVVPFLQPYHGTYGDYWRFTPLALRRMFEDAGMALLYLSYNSHRAAAVYLFAIASWQPERWRDRFDWRFSVEVPRALGDEPYVGCRALPNRLHRWPILFRRFFRSPGRTLARLLGG